MTTTQNIDQILAGLSPQKRRLYEKMLAQKRAAKQGPPPIPRRDPNRTAPLSFAQQRMWLIDRLIGSSAYHIPITLRLSGPLDVAALERAFLGIVRRHEILRTTFAAPDGEPRPVIHDRLAPAFEQIDLSERPDEQSQAALERRVQEAANRDFDLETGPLLRVLLITLAPEEFALCLTLHHIVSDGWTNAIILKELAALYTWERRPSTPPPPDPEIQYADFAAYQRDRLQGAFRDKLLTYWKAKLSGDLPQIQLPFDYPRPATANFDGAAISFTINARNARSLKKIAREEGATLFMTLLAAFGALLGRYSGQTDILIGAPVANRNHPQTENLIGSFANTLVPRLDLAPTLGFRQLLTQVRQTMLEAQDHQDLPFELLVETLQPQRDMSRNPLFQVLFALQPKSHTEGLSLEDVRMSWLHLAPTVAQLDLSLSIVEDDHDGLAASLIYPTALFARETVARLSQHFLTLINGLLGRPEARLADLALLSDRERRQIVRDWNQTEMVLTSHSFLDLFAAGPTGTPDAAALVFAGQNQQTLTYQVLDRRANRLAHQLKALGAGPDTLIALALPRSLELVIAMLAVLKTGSAYIPLDPQFPNERLTYMLTDSNAALLLTTEKAAVRSAVAIPTIYLDKPERDTNPESSSPPKTVIGAEQLAYVIYTSGSTGKPKGVQIAHRALANFLQSMRQAPGLTSADSLLSVTTISFDIAHLELYLPLITGAKLLLTDEQTTADGARLIRLLQTTRVTAMQATPATWRMLLLAGWRAAPNLKILCGGEALDEALARELIDMTASLWNMYGPTETTIWSSIYKVKKSAFKREQAARAVSLGRPIANTQVYILDKRLNPTPIGVPGELHIGGVGLARGYRNLPAITAEKFIANPFQTTGTGGRLYRTGDRARYRVTGGIEYMGRLDHQIKLRGFRIELGDIESALGEHPQISQAVVILSTDPASEQQLTAYLVFQDDKAKQQGKLTETSPLLETLSREKWVAYLKDKLPAYMIPTWFVQLSAIPLTPNGKTDRRALSGLAWRPDQTAKTPYAAPRNQTEQALTKIWASTLKIERVGIHDDFFALGGHSLLAVQLVVKIRETFQTQIPPARLFDQTTVAALAELIDATRSAEQLQAPRPTNRKIELESGEI